MFSAPKKLLTQHVTKTRQAGNPTISDDLTGSQSLIGMRGEVLFTGPHQARGLAREIRPDNPPGQLEHIGFALILGCRRDFSCGNGTPG
jgi:hypothetical protein